MCWRSNRRGPSMPRWRPRDRALARAVAAAALRRQGELELVLRSFLERPLPADKGRLWPILLAGAAQLVCLGMPAARGRRSRRRDHAARPRRASLRQARQRRAAARRRARGGHARRPGWRASQHPGLAVAAAGSRPMAPRPRAASPRRACARRRSTSRSSPTPTRRPGPRGSADSLLATGSIRLAAHGRIEDLPGYAEGAWWVQDAAAALVARLAGDVSGQRPSPTFAPRPAARRRCSPPPERTVTAVDVSAQRLERLRENLAPPAARRRGGGGRRGELGAGAHLRRRAARCAVHGDRHHPPPSRHSAPQGPRGCRAHGADCRRACWHMRPRSCAPGGLIVYGTCSLEPEEGEQQTAAFLAAHPDFARQPVAAAEIGAEPEWISADGDLRTLPFHGAAVAAGACGHGRLLCGAAAPAVLTVAESCLSTHPACARGSAAWLRCSTKLSDFAWRTFPDGARAAPARTAGSRPTAREQVSLALLSVGQAGRGALARMRRSRLLRWRYRVRGGRRAAAGAARPAGRRRQLRRRGGLGQLRARRLRRHARGRSPFAVAAAEPAMGARAARLRLAAPPRSRAQTRGRPRARPAAGRRMDPAQPPARRPTPGRPDVVARRLISWLSHAGLLLDGVDDRRYAAVMTQPRRPGDLSLRLLAQRPRRLPAPAVPDRARLRRRVHRRPRAPAGAVREAARRGAGTAGSARRRASEPQPRAC